MLRKMTHLATPGSIDTNIFRHSFLSILPTDVRTILANEEGTLAELAVKADWIIEARGATATSLISAITAPPPVDQGLAALAQEVAVIRQSLSGRGNPTVGAVEAGILLKGENNKSLSALTM